MGVGHFYESELRVRFGVGACVEKGERQRPERQLLVIRRPWPSEHSVTGDRWTCRSIA